MLVGEPDFIDDVDWVAMDSGSCKEKIKIRLGNTIGSCLFGVFFTQRFLAFTRSRNVSDLPY